MALSLSWHERAEDLPADLWAEGFAPPLEGRWWYRALERSHLEDQFRFLYALVRDGDARPIAIAPCFVMDVPLEMFVPEPLLPVVRPMGRLLPSLLHQRTLFVGSPCSDRGWIGLRAGADRPAVLSCIHRAVIDKARRLGAPMRVWKDFPEEFAPDLQRLAAAEGMFRVVSFPGTEVLLPPGGKETYLRTLPGRHRERLKRNLKLSRREVELDTTVCQSPDAVDLDEAFGLFWQTYEHSSTRFERLNRGFFAEMAACPQSRFILMRHQQDGRLVAFMLCFDLGSTLVNKFVGFDYARPRDWRLYFRLWDAFLDLAFSTGKERVESGQTGYSGKLSVGHQLLPLTNYCHHANPALRMIYRAVGARVSWESLDEDLAQHLGRQQD